uniref:Uncharacterized protein n=1 Tax=Arundo donax TaxID=35708 RepID=A0A0A9DK31_ARUDO
MEMGNKLYLISLKVEGLLLEDDLGYFENKDDGNDDPNDKGLKDEINKEGMDTDQQDPRDQNTKDKSKMDTLEPSKHINASGSKTVPLWASMFLDKEIDGAIDSEFGEMQCTNLLREMELADSESEEEDNHNLVSDGSEEEMTTLYLDNGTGT